ncbi:helix-turn-helix transcriptional regulator [Enterocloster bolteae]|jgi:putative transcriptional regulator|uniref:helix-turn-helix transcriptional regulator n=1 Tax=Enterocloster bolteae TaxID=208479 RepID=UPI00210DAE2A|nr:helix-turn-helix domain-containing protein [Enterocloster bolteae]MCQ4754636.1 helix-turn-helix domain-containing protein [Enterocloster bolteae]
MKEGISMAVKCKLKEIRQERGLQQDELAEAVLTDKRTISRYETGVRNPTLEMALRLSAYFHLAVNELFELEELR